MANGTFRAGDRQASYTIASGTNTDHVVKVSLVDSAGTAGGSLQGDVAHDAVDSGNPVKVGFRAVTGARAAVAAGDRSDSFCDPQGNLLTRPTGYYSVTMAGAGVGAIFGISYASDGNIAPSAVLGYAYNGASLDAIKGDTNLLSIGKGLTATRWRYTSGASPILSNTTTAVTVKTAAGAGVKNAIDAIQLTTTAFGASVPLAIRDGAGGTVLWALTVPTAGFLQPVSIVFEQPIVGTANTLLEVVTTTANTTGTVTLNVQGHTEI